MKVDLSDIESEIANASSEEERHALIRAYSDIKAIRTRQAIEDALLHKVEEKLRPYKLLLKVIGVSLVSLCLWWRVTSFLNLAGGPAQPPVFKEIFTSGFFGLVYVLLTFYFVTGLYPIFSDIIAARIKKRMQKR